MSFKNISIETVGLHVGEANYARQTSQQVPYKKSGVLTCGGISIFGDCSSIGGLAAVTIGPPDSGTKLPFTDSLYVLGNSQFIGDKTKKPNAVVIAGDLLVTGSTDTGNKGRLASRFATADAKPKPFDLEHPTKGKGHRLRYACIEGPEVGVYYRGRLTGSNRIELPYYWKDLVHAESITVQLQPIGVTQKIIVMDFDNEKIILSGNIDCFFHVYGERKDINPLITEYEGDSWKDYPDPNFNPDKVDEDERTYNDPRFDGPPNTITK